MKKRPLSLPVVVAAVALLALSFASSVFAAPTTRYWDSCKPSCGWSGNAGSSPHGVCASCDSKGVKQSGEGGNNICMQNGPSFTCMGQAPWAVSDNLSYGFAAAHANGDCGKCYELTFTNTGVSGKKMVIMVSNIGDIKEGAAYDLMIPGGGTGDFNGLTKQVDDNGGSSSNLGNQWGGFRTTCGANATCIRGMCDAAFSTAGLADLKAGCYWYIDWFAMADNPNANATQVTCPNELVEAYKNGKRSGSNPPPQTTTYTLTVNRNNNSGGTVTPTSQSNISSGTPVNISATANTGWTFLNWTVQGSGATIASPTSASTTVTLTANATIVANFQQQGGQPPVEPPVTGGCAVPAARTNIIKVEAESYISKVGDKMETTDVIGYIEDGYSATYSVTAPRAGQYSMRFNIASAQDIRFDVKVNNSNVGSIANSGTGDWGAFQNVLLCSGNSGVNVQLNQGSNTVVLEFKGAVNVDYFELFGEPANAVLHSAVGRNARAKVSLTPAVKGFAAHLPANHGYVGYSLIDLRGREIRSGKIGQDVTDLRFGGLNRSVMFLKLEGKSGAPLVLRAVTY